jgi:diguanylate cyclase (GGDEF)-like protein/PAS domain S-box-containing protein
MSQVDQATIEQDGASEPPLRFLMVDSDSKNTARLAALVREPYPEAVVESRDDVEGAIDALSGGGWDVACIGVEFAGEEGLDMIGACPTIAPKTAVLGISARRLAKKEVERITAVGALDCLSLEGLTPALLERAVHYGVNRKRFEEKLRLSNDQMVRNLIDLRDAKERAEEQSAAYVEAAEQLALAKERLEGALTKAEESERRYRMLSDNSPVGIWQMDVSGASLYMNEAARRLVEIGVEDDCGAVSLADVVYAEDGALSARAVLAWADGGEREVEMRLVGRATGRIRHLVMSGVAVPGTDGSAASILVTAVDITERKEVEAAIQHMAHHDALTGLPNRTLFVERIQLALADAARKGGFVGVLFLDLDHFKDVNDTLGHPVGDKLLMEVSERLLTCVRESDTVARLGGDEFAILCTNLIHPEQTAQLAQRIVTLIAKPYVINGHEIHTATSIGIAIYPTDATEPDKLVSFADMALYTSKEAGRSTFHFFDKRMDEEVQSRKALENELREALESGDFVLHFQPQIDLRSGAVVGAEALVRWRHKTRGLIYPGEFIPIAEQCGLIGPLGQWVIRAAFEQAKAWDQTLPIRIAINLSAVQFKQKNLLAKVSEMAAEAGVDPQRVEFEITESMLMENTDFAVSTMKGLSDLGSSLSIDDFGTGFSSLAYLKKFPVDCLKIDRSFVSDVLEDPDDAIIASSIIKLAHSLGLKVVAEGVETRGQVEFLEKEGCDYVQGFYFARPMAVEELESRVVSADGRWVADGEKK